MDSCRRTTITTFKRILRELRNANEGSTAESPLHKYLRRQMNWHKNATQCEAVEARHSAKTYAIYLESKRNLDEIRVKYFNGTERTVNETARMVGLEVPEEQRWNDI